MKDTFLKCSSCGIRFLWTAREQKEASREGATPPDRCPGCRALDMLLSRHKGVVRFYDPRKGWGFIDSPIRRKIFFHRNGLENPVRRGTVVSFRIAVTDRGLRAVAIRPVRRPS